MVKFPQSKFPQLISRFPQLCLWGVLALVALGCAPSREASEPAAQESAPQQNEAAIPGSNRPKVVATNTVLCDLTQQIAGDTIALTCLLDYGQDPHVYKPSPADRVALDEANLILYGGYGFEPTIIGLIEATSNPAPKVAVYEEAVPDPILAEGHSHDHGEEVHAEEAHAEETHGEADREKAAPEDKRPDPHVWQNAANNEAISAVLAMYLSAVAPQFAAEYGQKANDLTRQFSQLDQWIKAQAATVPAGNRTLITTHDAFRYFATAYGFEVGGVLSGLSSAEKPSAATLTDLVEDIKAAQVPAVFAEATTNPKLIATVAKDAGVEVAEQSLYDAGPGGPGSNAETVQSMLVTNTCTIVNTLGGRCDRASAPQ